MNHLSKQEAVLVCQLCESREFVTSENVTITHTPLACLSEATQRNFGLIIVSFSTQRICSRDNIIELFACLRNNRLTGETPLFALIETLHRELVVQMRHAGVGFMEIYWLGRPLDPRKTLCDIQRNDVSVRIDRFLAGLCPFLTYSPIDDRVELVTCRAYRNRMVLGGKRLHEVCETETYLHCEYYLNPRMEK
jgi:hypothetical protein